METWVYISVVRLEAWPSITWIIRKSVPLSNKCVANECRKSCTLKDLLIPAPDNARLNTFRILSTEYLPPYCPSNNQSQSGSTRLLSPLPNFSSSLFSFALILVPSSFPIVLSGKRSKCCENSINGVDQLCQGEKPQVLFCTEKGRDCCYQKKIWKGFDNV